MWNLERMKYSFFLSQRLEVRINGKGSQPPWNSALLVGSGIQGEGNVLSHPLKGYGLKEK